MNSSSVTLNQPNYIGKQFIKCKKYLQKSLVCEWMDVDSKILVCNMLRITSVIIVKFCWGGGGGVRNMRLILWIEKIFYH